MYFRVDHLYPFLCGSILRDPDHKINLEKFSACQMESVSLSHSLPKVIILSDHIEITKGETTGLWESVFLFIIVWKEIQNDLKYIFAGSCRGFVRKKE